MTTNVASTLGCFSVILKSNAHALEDYQSKLEVKSKKKSLHSARLPAPKGRAHDQPQATKMATLNLPPLKPAAFRWHSSPTDPNTIQRLAIGTEQWVGIKHENAKGQYENYLNTTLQLDISGLSLRRLSIQLAAALVHLRFSHPEVAATAVWEEGKPTPPLIQYTPPADDAAALRWARSCVSVRTSPLNGLALRAELERERRATAPESKRSVSVFIIGDVASEETPLIQWTRVDVLCRFNHIYWDAMSSRQFVGDLLRRVGDVWDSSMAAPIAEYRWGREVANLSEPILDSLKVDVETLGEDFVKARDEFITSLINSGVSFHCPPCSHLLPRTVSDTRTS